MATCIYCRRDDTAVSFNREHVMPQAFGLFRDNWVLDAEVCMTCNSALGKEVETPAARGSIEGVHRYLTRKLMGPDSFLKIPGRRVRWEIDELGWEGVRAYFEATQDGTDVQVMFRPQVMVTYENDERKTFLPEQLTDRKVFAGVKAYRAYAVNKDDLQKL